MELPNLTVIVSLKHFHFLLVVRPAEQLALLDDVLIALLKSNSAHHADKALEMEHVIQGSHY